MDGAQRFQGSLWDKHENMTNLAAFFLPLAFVLPVLAPAEQALAPGEAARLTAEEAGEGMESAPAPPLPVQDFFDARYPEERAQVRIERRVTIRISPRRSAPRQDMLAEFPQSPTAPQFEERKMGKCLPIDAIAGVQPGDDNRLILYLRNRQMVSAALDRDCNAQDFYSGFYVDRTKDGNICVSRDELQSRSGASCEFNSLNQLVAIRD